MDKYPSIFSAQNRGCCVYYPSKRFHMHLILKPFAVKAVKASKVSKLKNLCGC